VTPTELFFVRTHGAVPEIDPSSYRLTIGGLVREPVALSLTDLGRFERVEVTAALQCAGNRRSELAAVSPIPGQVPWGAGAVGNGVWGGIRLRDLLEASGLEVESGHVAFTGLDEVEEEGESTRFGASIPLETALLPNVLLADELNGQPLPPVHGYPLRVVVPGTIGARSVKWLSSVTVQHEPSSNYFQARTYRLIPASLRSEADEQERGLELGEFPINAVTCEVRDDVARGYALTGGQRRIARVEISLDGGKTWEGAELLHDGPAGSWRLWQADLSPCREARELVVRAWDTSASTQPESAAATWNVNGYVNNAWHRVELGTGSRR
jgi:sulfite oxidase